MTIAYDLDGVIIDILPHIRQWFLDNKNFDILNQNINKFHFWHPPEYNPVQFKEDVCKAIIGGAPLADPVESDTVTALYAIEDLTGFEPLFITARHKRTEDVTIDWLNKWIDTDYGLEIVEGSKNKANYIKNLNKVVKDKYQIKYYVEDRFRTCNQLAPILDIVFCFNQIWNMGREFKYDNIIRVDSLWDVYSYLKKEDKDV